MFEKIKKSFSLMKESMKVLKHDKELVLFPIISGIALVIVFLSFLIPSIFADVFSASRYVSALVVFAFYFVSYFVIIFFNTALISCAHIRFNGKDPKLSDGLSHSAKNIGKILGWTAIAATVGLILKILADKADESEGVMGIVAHVIVAIIGLAWSLLTFFVIPVMVFEGKGVFASIKRSGQLIKSTWGENIVADASIGLATFILALIGIIPLFLIGYFVGLGTAFLVTLGIVVVYWLLLAILSSSLQGIFVAALYNYAKNGKMPHAYNAADTHIFRSKAKRR